ncbi:hypothetical protein [Vibrio navarrensis]|nr:hypothetical protein [Vibrio navarrensis]
MNLLRRIQRITSEVPISGGELNKVGTTATQGNGLPKQPHPAHHNLDVPK